MNIVIACLDDTNLKETAPSWENNTPVFDSRGNPTFIPISPESLAHQPFPSHDNLPVITGQNMGVVGMYQIATDYLREMRRDMVVGFVHDDVIMRDSDWHTRVLDQFEDPSVGVVGFGGALRHGSPDLYKTRYHISQLGRGWYMSNVDDAEVHGERFTGVRDVAILDGFALFTRLSLLEKAGGWPVQHLQFHCYDLWLCCVARRLGYKIRLVGVRCHHLGGRSTVRKDYQKFAVKKWGMTDAEIHTKAHDYIYREFRDVLPYEVPHG